MSLQTPHSNAKKAFRTRLMSWNKQQNRRKMPWKGEKNAYRIWLSEIILQQTRVEQGLAYYERFTSRFPAITDLAAAPDDEVMKLWEGLGYYSRCRNLIATARYVANEMNGKFPESYEAIHALKGIGPYTAAAIASFAFNLPHAVVDGNVYRVLARVFGIKTPTDSTEGKKFFTNLANELLDTADAGKYNQAIMDFGATICKPMAPLCDTCVFQKDCVAYQTNRIELLPVKEKKLRIRIRHFNFFLLKYKDQILIRQRTGKDIWQQLYELPLLETTIESTEKEARIFLADDLGLGREDIIVSKKTISLSQQLSHQKIKAVFYSADVKKKSASSATGYKWVTKEEVRQLAFPRLIRDYLDAIL